MRYRGMSFGQKQNKMSLGPLGENGSKYETKKRDMIWKDGKKKFESTVVELDGH